MYTTPGIPVPGNQGYNTGQVINVPTIGQLVFSPLQQGANYSLYVGADQTTTGGGLYKLVSSVGTAATTTWTAVSFGVGAYKNAAAGVGVHGLTGRVEGTGTALTYALYLSTSEATANYL